GPGRVARGGLRIGAIWSSSAGYRVAGAPQPAPLGARGRLDRPELTGAVVTVGRNVQHAGVAALDQEAVDVDAIDRDVRERASEPVSTDHVVVELDGLSEHQVGVEPCGAGAVAIVVTAGDLGRV